MALRLEQLQPGTPVFAGATRVGEVEGVYADGDSRSVEVIACRWTSRDTLVALSSSDVETIDESGVILIGGNPDMYAELAPFDPAGQTTLHPIAPSE
jgi:hypothetical protein